jgi:hypothetical protein
LEDEFPTAEHWRSFATAPDQFDPNSVWSYTIKKKDPEGKPCSECVFCKKTFLGHNATKMQLHQSGLHSTEVHTCLGCSNGALPVWFRESLKSAVVKQPNDKRAAEKVSDFVCFNSDI